jgi:ribosomal protein S27AE
LRTRPAFLYAQTSPRSVGHGRTGVLVLASFLQLADISNNLARFDKSDPGPRGYNTCFADPWGQSPVLRFIPFSAFHNSGSCVSSRRARFLQAGAESMKLTDSMRRCLVLLARHGEALRVWCGKSGYEWSWRIDGAAMTSQVDRCIRAGYLDLASRDRVVLSPLGQRVMREIKAAAARRTSGVGRLLAHGAHETQSH